MSSEESIERCLRLYRELGIEVEELGLLSHFRLLGLDLEDCDDAAVISAYRAQTKRLLAFKARRDRFAVELLRSQIDRAYEVLKDPERRARYELERELARRARPGALARAVYEALLEGGSLAPTHREAFACLVDALGLRPRYNEELRDVPSGFTAPDGWREQAEPGRERQGPVVDLRSNQGAPVPALRPPEEGLWVFDPLPSSEPEGLDSVLLGAGRGDGASLSDSEEESASSGRRLSSASISSMSQSAEVFQGALSKLSEAVDQLARVLPSEGEGASLRGARIELRDELFALQVAAWERLMECCEPVEEGEAPARPGERALFVREALAESRAFARLLATRRSRADELEQWRRFAVTVRVRSASLKSWLAERTPRPARRSGQRRASLVLKRGFSGGADRGRVGRERGSAVMSRAPLAQSDTERGPRRLSTLAPGEQRRFAGLSFDGRAALAVYGEDGEPRLVPSALGALSRPLQLTFGERDVVFSEDRSVDSEQADGFLLGLGVEGWARRYHGRDFPAEVLVALAIDALLREVPGPRVTDIVVAAPAFLSSHQRMALYVAGQIAGVQVLDVLELPMAVGLTGLDDKLAAPGSQLVALHHGQRCLEAALLEAGQDGFGLRGACRERRLGLEAFEAVVVDELSRGFATQEGFDPRADEASRKALVVQARAVLLELFDRRVARCLVTARGRVRSVAIEPARFFSLAEPLIVEGRELVEDLLQPGLGQRQAERSVVVSGPAGVLESLVKRVLGGRGPATAMRRVASPMAARGALSWARRLSSEPTGFGAGDGPRAEGIAARVRRGLLEDVGVKVETAAGPRVCLIAEAGRLVPGRFGRTVGVTGPGLSVGGVLPRRGVDILIGVMLGCSEDPAACEQLAELRVGDPGGINTELRVEVVFAAYEGCLTVIVSDPLSGEQRARQELFGERRRGIMGEAAIVRWRRDLTLLRERGPAALRPRP